MSWLKDAVVDILATVIVVLAVTLDLSWARWIVWIYTPLMLALKLAALFAGGSRKLKTKPSTVPAWFHHLLYAVTFAAAVFDRWWPIAAGWALIWILSAYEAHGGPKK